MAKLTKADQYKMEEIITSIWAGVEMALDPIDQKELYKKITSRLREDLTDLRATLELN
jgi:hypothetical protein